MKVIMISGKAGHGKDTAAKFIKSDLEKQNEKVLIIHFGDAVKWFAREYYNWNGEKDTAGRDLLQYIGTTMMRTYDESYWGMIVSKFIAANKDFTYAIIPDWRFYSELDAITANNNNCFTMRIERPDYVNPNMTPEQLQHISETELDNCYYDCVVYNDADLEEFYENLKIAIDLFKNL